MTQSYHKSARQWALRALTRRMHTTHEIRAALSRRRFEDDVVGSVMDELGRQGYIDDLHFTRVWVSSRSSHQLHGRLRLLRDLRQKGIPDDMAESVIRDLLPDEEEAAIAIKAAEKKLRSMRSIGKSIGKAAGRAAGRATGAKCREALYRHLRSRGFTAQAIRLAMAGLKFEEDPS